MRKIDLFRTIGESFARTMYKYASSQSGLRFFNETAVQMFPDNLHRREWAVSNMKMFYQQERERVKIMETLRNTAPTDTIGNPSEEAAEILEMIRARQD